MAGNGNGNGNGSALGSLPPWVRGVAVIGIPGAIAMFLVWVGAKELPRILSLVESNHVRLGTVIERQAQQDERLRETYRLLQRICSNTARNDDERTRCFD